MRHPDRENGAPLAFYPQQQSWPSRPVRPNRVEQPRDPRSWSAPKPSATAPQKPLLHPPVLQSKEDQPPKLDRTVLGFSLCLVSLTIGIFALKTSSVDKIGPYGLIQALSPLYYFAIALLIISFAWSLRTKRHRSVLLSSHLIIMVLLVHGAPLIVEGVARFQTAYEHVGFVGYIADNGDLLPQYDARFSWPSFFEGMAMLDRVAGVSSAEVFIGWWPVAMNLLYLPLIYGIANAFLRSKLKAWVAAGLFPLINWVGQDYFSPQSLAYLLYLTFIFILVGPLGARDRPMWQFLFRKTADEEPAANRQMRPGSPSRPRQAPSRPVGFYLGLLVLLMAAMATGHQLTPVIAVVTTIVLVVSGRTRIRGIAVVVPLIAIGWICYGASSFWSGHIGMMIGGLGNVGGNVGSGVTQRVSGNAAHEFVVDGRLVISVLVWGLALLGAIVWRPRNGNRAAVVLLFLAAFSTIAGGDYGGEGVLRVYLFSLPGAACLIAALISTLPRFWQGQVALTCTLLLLTPLFLVARWGNELYEMELPDELAATNMLYRIAAPGSTLVSENSFITWRYTELYNFQYETVGIDTIGPQTLTQITATVAGNPKGGFVIFTADQAAYGWLVNGMPENWSTTVEGMLAHSANYKLRYANRNAAIFQYIPHPQVKKSSASKTTQSKKALR
jgi:hypothetical protein